MAVILVGDRLLAVSIFNPFRMLLPKLPVDIGNLVVSGTKITDGKSRISRASLPTGGPTNYGPRRQSRIWPRSRQCRASRVLRAKVMMEDRSMVTLDARDRLLRQQAANPGIEEGYFPAIIDRL